MDQDTRVIEESIARDRASVARTLDELARRVDVKERVRDSVEHKTTQIVNATPANLRPKLRALEQRVRANPLPFVVAAAFAVGLLAGRIGRHR